MSVLPLFMHDVKSLLDMVPYCTVMTLETIPVLVSKKR